MIRYKDYSVSGNANTETLSDTLVGSTIDKYFINSVSIIETTATPNNDAVIEIWHESELLQSFSILHLLQNDGTTVTTLPNEVPINLELKEGYKFRVGMISGSTASNIRFRINYEINKTA